MAEEIRERWMSYLAMTTVILAVCATLSSFKGGGYSTRSVLSQTQASDQWAFYQSKSIKGYLYELSRDKIELEMKGFSAEATLRQDYQKKVEAYAAKVKKYEEEKAQIEKDAKALEAVRNDATKHSQAFGMSVIFLQIAILLSSIAALTKRKPVWAAGLVCGAVGIVYFLNGFFMFLP